MIDVPTRDGQFYADLDAMAQRVGAKAEDLLLVWSSESGLRTDLQGSSRTFSTLMKYVAVPGLMDEATWERLPSMSAREQLPFVEKAIYSGAHKILGRPFRSTFEVYLANAAPGLLRPDGNYNPATVMYEGSNYPDNWAMDNAPAGVVAAQKDGVKLSSLRGTYEYAKTLVDRGVLKGYVSLGDLQAFGKRLLSGSAVLNKAIEYLHNVRANVAAGMVASVDAPMPDFLTQVSGAVPSSSTYEPNFDAFPVGAPLDTRVATPEKARRDLPKNANLASQGLPVWPVIVGGSVALGLALTFLRKK